MNYGRQTSSNWDNRMPGWLASSPRREHYNPASRIGGTSLGKAETSLQATREAQFIHAHPARYQSILVPVDGNPFAEHALPLALSVARRARACVRIVHVHSPLQLAYKPDDLYYGSGLDAFLKHRQQTYLECLARRVAKVSSVPVTPLFLQGKDIASSLYESASVGTDLVVMATHGRRSVGRLLFGSVADVLMRRLSVPVLFTRGYNSPADLTGNPLMRHILIALNGSELAEQVLKPAIALGTLSDADHTLLRVIPSMMDYSAGYPNGFAHQPLVLKQQAEARRYLRSIAQRLDARTLRISTRVILDDRSTANAILNFAQIHDADVIALATQGRGGLARLLRGSVAHQVVRRASVPVLVFRPHTQQDGRPMP
jgi:nucleotide-binding universal stress UspA family protein